MREISSTENWLLITLSMALSGVIYGLIAFPGEPGDHRCGLCRPDGLADDRV